MSGNVLYTCITAASLLTLCAALIAMIASLRQTMYPALRHGVAMRDVALPDVALRDIAKSGTDRVIAHTVDAGNTMRA